MFVVKKVEEVFKIIIDNFQDYSLGDENLDIRNAAGRILSDRILSKEEIPGFNRSSVDGYAVISSDTFGASDAIPAQLELIGEVLMGEKTSLRLGAGQTVYVPTGGELPEKADSVVMIEYTEDYKDGFIYINKSTSPGNSVVFMGDDVVSGSVVLKADHYLRPQDIGALAALGYETIKVKRKIRVGIISTGDEIVDISEKPSGTKVRDINTYSLYAGALSLGAEPIQYGIVGDDYEKLRIVVKKAVSECDIILISGGSSVGAKDETAKVINSFDAPGILVHGIAVKPGKPTIFGKVNGKAIFGLPGHPASAFMIFKIFVGFLLEVMNKRTTELKNVANASMKYNYPSNNGREEYLPVKLEEIEGVLVAEPIFGKSGLITLLTSADGYVHVSRESEGITQGEKVNVTLF